MLGKVRSVLFLFLAGADFLMGLYLVIIAIKDIQYRGNYNFHAYAWYNSWECTLIGILAMISSEVC
jgi:leucine-rich repeat-containing G protein-coupled receptor 7